MLLTHGQLPSFREILGTRRRIHRPVDPWLGSLVRSLCGVVLLMAPAWAQDVYAGKVCEATGNSYFQSRGWLTIDEARELAAGMGGALLALGSADEERWIREVFGSERFWIGLVHPHERWATGEPVTYANWSPGEPNAAWDRPFVLMNWREEAAGWNDVSGDPVSNNHRAIIEVPGREAVLGLPEEPTSDVDPAFALRCALVVGVENLTFEDFEDRKNEHLAGLLEESAIWREATCDLLGDVRTGWGLLVWGVGYWRSRLTLMDDDEGEGFHNQHVLGRLEGVRPDVYTASLLPRPTLSGKVLGDGISNARIVGAAQGMTRASEQLVGILGREGPVCAVVGWGADEPKAPKKRARQASIRALDLELGRWLAALRGRPDFGQEEWLVVVAGVGLLHKAMPIPGEVWEQREFDPWNAPLLVQGLGFEPGERFDGAHLADVVPTLLRHFGAEGSGRLRLDGLALRPSPAQPCGENLLRNGDAEAQSGWERDWEIAQIPGWTCRPYMNVVRAVHVEDVSPAGSIGGRAAFRAFEQATGMEQFVDLRPWSDDIDGGRCRFELSARLGGAGDSSRGFLLTVEFLTEKGKSIETVTVGPVTSVERRGALGHLNGIPGTGLVEASTTGRVPRKARRARVFLDVPKLIFADDEVGPLADDLSLVLRVER